MAINLSTLLTPSASTQQAFAQAGPMLTVFGAVNSAIGSYYQAKASEYQFKSQSSSLAFQADMAQINQRRAEFQAYTIMEAGARQMGALTMKAGQAKASAKASMAARGIQLGVGSAAEAIATTDLMKEIDALTLNTNRVRAAEEARMQAVGYGTQASMLGVSAQNALASAQGISPFGSAATSLLGSASSLASNWYRNKPVQTGA